LKVAVAVHRPLDWELLDRRRAERARQPGAVHERRAWASSAGHTRPKALE
jgi:hypothetical protein